MARKFIMLAGPNGAGKSSFYELFLSEMALPFVNADLIAESAGLEPYEAAKAAGVVRERFLQLGVSFIAETVFSDPVGDKLELLREAVRAEYEVTLIYIGLDSVPLAQARVGCRVVDGGHDVPDAKIAARYPRSLSNLKSALEFVPHAVVYDNSSATGPYACVAEVREGRFVRRAKPPFPRWTRGLFSAIRRK